MTGSELGCALSWTMFLSKFGSTRCRKIERAVFCCPASMCTLRIFTGDASALPAGKKRDVERLWQEFFSDPSHWWDHRLEKVNARYPDFKHKKTQEALWLNGKLNPPWVEAELAAMIPGSVQLNFFSWNSRLARCIKARQYDKAIELFQQMQGEGVIPDRFTFVPVLNACANLRALEEGRNLHILVMQSGCESDRYVGSTLVNMYAKCGSIDDAWKVFDSLGTRDVVAWNAMILGYAKCGQGHKALELFKQMQLEGVQAVPVTFVGVLNACASVMALDDGRYVHEQIIQRGFESHVFVGNSLVDMYAKCGDIEEAWRIFNKMPTRDVVSWNTMILGCVKCGQGQKALELFYQMEREGVEPVPVTFVGFLNACASVSSLEEGRHVHERIIQSGCESNIFVGNSLVDMYAKCGSIEDAWKVFNKLPSRNMVSWNAMILGYVKCGQGDKALELSQQMQKEGVQPGPVTFVALLNACASVSALEEGKCVHEQIIQRGYDSHVFVGNSLIDMYAKCGSIQDAWLVFNKLPTRDVVAWNAMISGYVKCGQGQKALTLFDKMQQEGVEPVPVTFVGVLNACATLVSLEKGRHLHKQIIRSGCESEVFVANSLVDMYWKCGSIEDAWRVFNKMPTRNVIAWNAMILGYVKCGQGQQALELFHQMLQESVDPDPGTFVGVVNACASLLALDEGRYVHKKIIQSGCQSNVFVSNSLIDMYAKCGSIEDAWRVFNQMPTHDVVAWNAMILGYVKCGQGQKALELSGRMQQEGVEPDPFSFVGFLNACASVSALEVGRHVHGQIIQRGWESDIFIGSSLIDMYAKCGSIEDACRVFNEIPIRNLVAWNAMLGGYSIHGHAKEAIGHFEQMCIEGVEMDMVTFVSLLSACSHAGLVDEGLHYFESLRSVYCISAAVEHYACVVDLLGRAGRLQEAEDLIKSMPCETDVTVWMSLLGACRVLGNVEMGERIAKQVIKLDPGNAGGYVLLSNIYAAAGKWDSRANVQQQRLERGVKKDPGHTWIEVNNEVHSFTVDDQEHPQLIEIHSDLKRLSGKMEEVGYVPDVKFVLHDVEEEEKVSHMCYHSEKLAIAFGLISTPPGTPLHIFKNLQVCVDCHNATKFIAKIVVRTIIVRDANRFHHFEEGFCSCCDYW